MGLAHGLGRQLACPSGIGGRLLAPLMRIANRGPTRLAIAAGPARTPQDRPRGGAGARPAPAAERGTTSIDQTEGPR